MTRTGIVNGLYSELVERRPFSRFTNDPVEQRANLHWYSRAGHWGNIYVTKYGQFKATKFLSSVEAQS